ncbi:MAG TPA: alkaline phosphatase PhoX, partial [Polyangiaceae bacterium]|nr:alkaline phosphatase PhoX [Polyangiaceae bacterium]
ALGALQFARGEGAAFDPTGPTPSLVFAATAGGPLELGQLFRLHLGAEGDYIELVAQASESNVMRAPDNLCVAPCGDVIIAEDGPKTQHLLGLTREGRIYAIAQNAVSSGEFAGVCFSPDGSTLFCNLQREGLTLAIRGPWPRLRASAV